MIREAKESEAEILTNISFSSKRYWNYPEENYEVWKDELSITPEYVLNNAVFVCEQDGEIIGYYSIKTRQQDIEFSGGTIDKGTWLDHMFIIPSEIGKGIGSVIFEHAIAYCKEKEVDVLRILADPNSKGFYEKVGCAFIKEFPPE